MKYPNLYFFLQVFSLRLDLSVSVRMKTLFTERNNALFDVDQFRDEVVQIANDKTVDLVGIALETQFAESREALRLRLYTDEVLIFTDQAVRPVLCSKFGYSPGDVEAFKETMRDIPSAVYLQNDVFELFESPDLAGLPFEIKTLYYEAFSEAVYTHEDILFGIKNVSWRNFLLQVPALPSNLQSAALEQLAAWHAREGWMDLSDLVHVLQADFPAVDLFQLSQLDWGEDTEHLRHYKNRMTPGFKRYRRL